MSDPLSYQTLPPNPNAPLRAGTWIYTLILGILYCVGGLCFGASMLFVGSIVGARVGGAGVKTVLFIVGLIMFLIPAACGGAYIWSAFAIRRGSRAGAITAMVIAIINAAILLILVVLGAIGLATATDPKADARDYLGVLFNLLPVAMNIAAIVLLMKLLKQWRRAAY